MNDRTTLRTCVHLIGGPRDGYVGNVTMAVPPGELPRYGYYDGGFKHVYQATVFTPDDCGMEPMRMEYVQVIDSKGDVYG
jgi:hypothetical protein